MWSYNTKTWSEVYVLLKLLSEAVLYGADADLQKNDNISYPVKKVGYYGTVLESSTGDEITYKRNSLLLLEKIQNAPEGSQTFENPEIESFLKDLGVDKLPADTSGITVVTSHSSDQNPTLRFKIKSQLSGPATLLNPSAKTNFIYEIENIVLSPNEIDNINSLEQIRHRIEAAKGNGATFRFIRTQENIFGLNMQLIDSHLPEIMGHLLLDYYSTTGPETIKHFLEMLNERNPCNFPSSSALNLYRLKVKQFLAEIAFGMMPSEPWDGSHDTTTGLIVIRDDGEVLCYHVYNHNEFEEYLLKNTRFATPGTTQWEYGKIYQEGNKFYIKLNLQIKFI